MRNQYIIYDEKGNYYDVIGDRKTLAQMQEHSNKQHCKTDSGMVQLPPLFLFTSKAFVLKMIEQLQLSHRGRFFRWETV